MNFPRAWRLAAPDVLAIVKGATAITAQRVDTVFNDDPKIPLAERADQELKVLGDPVPVPEPFAAELKRLFTQGATYLADSKRCRFRANVRYVFTGANADKADIVLCFGCGELEVWKGGEMVAFSPFDARYAELLKVAQEIFPKDAFLAEFDPAVFERRVKEMRKQ